MPKFRKKPVVIEAIQWDGTAHSTLMVSQFVGQELELKKNVEDNINNRFFLMIPTLESPHEASNGDWIIKGVKGEFYPCKPDIFAATYSMASESGMSFGEATEAAKAGKKVSRVGWNGSGMYAYYVPAQSYPALTDIAKQEFGDMVPYRAYWALKTAQGDVATWAPSGSDSLAEDWQIVE